MNRCLLIVLLGSGLWGCGQVDAPPIRNDAPLTAEQAAMVGQVRANELTPSDQKRLQVMTRDRGLLSEFEETTYFDEHPIVSSWAIADDGSRMEAEFLVSDSIAAHNIGGAIIKALIEPNGASIAIGVLELVDELVDAGGGIRTATIDGFHVTLSTENLREFHYVLVVDGQD